MECSFGSSDIWGLLKDFFFYKNLAEINGVIAIENHVGHTHSDTSLSFFMHCNSVKNWLPIDKIYWFSIFRIALTGIKVIVH